MTPRLLLAALAAITLFAAVPAAAKPDPAADTVDVVVVSAFAEAVDANDYETAAGALESFARNWPGHLALLGDDRILDVLANAPSMAPDSPRRAALLDALLAAGWAPQDPTWTFAHLWREVVLNRLEAGRVDAAKAAAAKIDLYTVVIRMRADKRFDPVARTEPGLPEPARLLDMWLTRARKGGDRRQVAGLLLDKGDPGAALKVVDEALQARDLEGWEQGVLLYNRSRALKELGRTDLAIEALKQAKAIESHWALDLANLLMSLDRGAEAVGVLDAADQADWSPRQRAIGATWRFCSLRRAGKPADEAPLRALAATLEAADRTSLLDSLLFCAGRRDEAAELYKQVLADPWLRGAFLFRLQQFAGSPHPTPGGQALDAWRREILARPDVRDALDRVGRIEAYPIRRPSDTG